MKIVIPLAGPDFVRPDGSVKATHEIEGTPLLRAALESRPWWRDGSCGPKDLTFVLHDQPATRAFVSGALTSWYPGCGIVWLAHYARGAALSALAGVSAIAHHDEPVVIDLVDILYALDLSVTGLFAADPRADGIALVFRSADPLYSYLRDDGMGHAIEAAEKRVISAHASAGTYVFRSPAVYLAALAVNLRRPEAVTHNGLFYVCPVFNGIVEAGRKVALRDVAQVRDIKVAA